MEPNPCLVTLLQSYRSCQVFELCVDFQEEHKTFVDQEHHTFTASCKTLTEILALAGMLGRRIDTLTIHVERSELSTLRSLDLTKCDIRVIVVEVGRGARWLEVDTELLPQGYAKVAVLGRDVVYFKLSDVTSRIRLGPHIRQTSYLYQMPAVGHTVRSREEADDRCLLLGAECGG